MKKLYCFITLGVAIPLLSFDAYALSGSQIYNQTCVACHGTTGKGSVPGAPDFTSPNGPSKNSNSVLLQRTINGYQTPGSPMAMPPKGGNPSLTNQDLQNTISYIRQRFMGKSTTESTLPKEQPLNLIKPANQTKQAASKANIPAAAQLPSSADSEMIARGAKTWAVTCSGCHNTRSPNEFTPDQWRTVMLHMRTQAKLSGQKTRDILKFLQSSEG